VTNNNNGTTPLLKLLVPHVCQIMFYCYVFMSKGFYCPSRGQKISLYDARAILMMFLASDAVFWLRVFSATGQTAVTIILRTQSVRRETDCETQRGGVGLRGDAGGRKLFDGFFFMFRERRPRARCVEDGERALRHGDQQTGVCDTRRHSVCVCVCVCVSKASLLYASLTSSSSSSSSSSSMA